MPDRADDRGEMRMDDQPVGYPPDVKVVRVLKGMSVAIIWDQGGGLMHESRISEADVERLARRRDAPEAPQAEDREQAMALVLSCSHGRWLGEAQFGMCVNCVAAHLASRRDEPVGERAAHLELIVRHYLDDLAAENQCRECAQSDGTCVGHQDARNDHLRALSSELARLDHAQPAALTDRRAASGTTDVQVIVRSAIVQWEADRRRRGEPRVSIYDVKALKDALLAALTDTSGAGERGDAPLREKLAALFRGAHYVDIVVRRGGKDEHHEGDWLKGFLTAALPQVPGERVGVEALDISSALSGEHLCPTCALTCRALAYARLRKGVERINERLGRALADPPADSDAESK